MICYRPIFFGSEDKVYTSYELISSLNVPNSIWTSKDDNDKYTLHVGARFLKGSGSLIVDHHPKIFANSFEVSKVYLPDHSRKFHFLCAELYDQGYMEKQAFDSLMLMLDSKDPETFNLAIELIYKHYP